MSTKKSTPDVGVIVGRFQVPELHDAHRSLISRVCRSHDKVVIFLGVSPLWSTRENPLDFEARKQMLLTEYPQVNVLFIKDVNNDEVWSRRLDRLIQDVVTPGQTVMLYGGRDSFIEHYSGKHPTTELEPDTWAVYSGTEIRRRVSAGSTKASADFRAGVVWGAYSRFPTCYTTVDVAIVNKDHLLLGRKDYEDDYRFIGGFAEPDSRSFEQDARREVMEETHLEVGNLQYLGSFQIDDWRYRSEVDKIKTVFFSAEYVFGGARPGDDIAQVAWLPIDSLHEGVVLPAHQPLMQRFLETR